MNEFDECLWGSHQEMWDTIAVMATEIKDMIETDAVCPTRLPFFEVKYAHTIREELNKKFKEETKMTRQIFKGMIYSPLNFRTGEKICDMMNGYFVFATKEEIAEIIIEEQKQKKKREQSYAGLTDAEVEEEYVQLQEELDRERVEKQLEEEVYYDPTPQDIIDEIELKGSFENIGR